MKLAKMILTGTVLFVPALAMGIAQQDPAQPAQPNQLQQDSATQTQPNPGSQQNLQQDSTQSGMKQDVVGTIEEVRDDSFSVKKDMDGSVVWFSITPELKSSYAAELVTGNHVRVSATAGESADRMMASSVMAEAGDSSAAADTTAADTRADFDADSPDADLDADAEVDLDRESATATLDTDSDTEIAQTESSLRQDDATYDNTADNELPRTASSLPSIGALGLLAILGAAAVAFARKF